MCMYTCKSFTEINSNPTHTTSLWENMALWFVDMGEHGVIGCRWLVKCKRLLTHCPQSENVACDIVSSTWKGLRSSIMTPAVWSDVMAHGAAYVQWCSRHIHWTEYILDLWLQVLCIHTSLMSSCQASLIHRSRTLGTKVFVERLSSSQKCITTTKIDLHRARRSIIHLQQLVVVNLFCHYSGNTEITCRILLALTVSFYLMNIHQPRPQATPPRFSARLQDKIWAEAWGRG